MIYGIAMLLFILGLLVMFPALRKLIFMQKVRKNGRITQGTVASTRSAMNTGGWLMGGITANEMVNHQRPLVTYRSPQGKEMSMEFVPSNFFSRQRYIVDETVEVVYDVSEPWRAYAVREWRAAFRDFGIGTAMCIVSVALWSIGRVYNMPF